MAKQKKRAQRCRLLKATTPQSAICQPVRRDFTSKVLFDLSPVSNRLPLERLYLDQIEF